MRWIQLLMAASLALGAAAETPAELARQLLTRYQQQVSAAPGVTYRFTHEGTGPLAQAFPPTSGEVKVVPPKPGKGLFERARISATSGAGEQAVSIDVVADGELVRSLDRKRERVVSAPVWRNGIELVNFQYLMPVALVPQLANLKVDGVRYQGEKVIGGTTCVVIEADTQMARLTLFVGKSDALLYGGEARKPEAWGNGVIRMSIDDMRIDRAIPGEAFRLETPRGYTEVQYSGSFPTLGAPAPGFTLAGFDGKPISLDKLEGDVVVLDFWATWCGPCKEAMPGLQRLHERYAAKGLKIIGVNHDERGDARAFLERHHFTYTFASSEGSDIAKNYKPNLPMAIVIDRQGRMVEVFTGYFGEASDTRLERLIKSLL